MADTTTVIKYNFPFITRTFNGTNSQFRKCKPKNVLAVRQEPFTDCD